MLPFVRGKADILALRSALEQAGAADIRIFAKIENMDGVRALPEFLHLADEIVIARGDLGNAMPLWELPRCQKQLSAACRAAGVPFMVVTQMLDSMHTRAVPTRAEVSDIYNAVLDGASSLMLTGETAQGGEQLRVGQAAVRHGGADGGGQRPDRPVGDAALRPAGALSASYVRLLSGADSAVGAGIAARTAVQAGTGVDHVTIITLGNSTHGASICTSAAADASGTDLISHFEYLH